MATLDAPKLINVTFALASGNFGSGGNSYAASGLRVQCRIDITGGLETNNASVAIYGLPLSVMNQLTTLGSTYQSWGKNGMMIEAGSDASAMSLIFQGNIWVAYVDGQNQPQVCLRVEGAPGHFWNVKPAEPLSFKGATPVNTIAKKIADSMGMGLIDLGVTTVLSNPYFPSDAMTQLHKLAEHSGISYTIHKNNVIISPPGGTSSNTVTVSPQTGLVGYPLITSNNMIVKALFNPNINFLDVIDVQSSLTPACGQWSVQKIEYELESKAPHGKWFMIMTCIPKDYVGTPLT